MIFNSQHQADAHFAGSRHAKKQKMSEDGTGEYNIIIAAVLLILT